MSSVDQVHAPKGANSVDRAESPDKNVGERTAVHAVAERTSDPSFTKSYTEARACTPNTAQNSLPECHLDFGPHDTATPAAATTEPERKYTPKTEFGKEVEDRYKDKNLTPQQRDFFAQLGDNSYQGHPNENQKAEALKRLDQSVGQLDHYNEWANKREQEEAKAWKQDYEKLSPDQKKFIDGVGDKFPSSELTKPQRQMVLDGAMKYAKSGGDVSEKGTENFIEQQKEDLVKKFDKNELGKVLSEIVKHGGKEVSDHADSFGRSADFYRLLTSGATKELLKDLGEKSPLVGLGIDGTVAGTQLLQDDVKGAIKTMTKAGIVFGAGVVGNIGCGGPETPAGWACSYAAATYANHVVETLDKYGWKGYGMLGNEVMQFIPRPEPNDEGLKSYPYVPRKLAAGNWYLH